MCANCGHSQSFHWDDDYHCPCYYDHCGCEKFEEYWEDGETPD